LRSGVTALDSTSSAHASNKSYRRCRVPHLVLRLPPPIIASITTGGDFMRFAFPTLAFGFVLASAPLLGAEGAASMPQYSKRQLADCMLKRMSSDRTVSYNDASKVCKDQLRGSKTDAALSNTNTPKPKPLT
jgi:hypothetical protein